MKIMAVENDPFILELLPLLAAKSGFPDVTLFSSSVQALHELSYGTDPFDCLLLDINMPVMTGIELCTRVRQVQAYRKTPIIMLTAMSEREFMDAAFQAGATDYVTKPFDISELGARLRVARELVTAWREARLVRQTHAAASAQQQHAFALSEAVDLDGAAGLVEFSALQNYLKQISRAGRAASQIIAVKVDRIAGIYDRATSQEFTYALGEVAGAITEMLRGSGVLVSYVGTGVFVVVSNMPHVLIPAEVESAVQQILDDKNAEYDSGAPLDIEVSIGNPIQLGSSGAADVSVAVDRAIARAECRCQTKRNQPALVNICPRTARQG